MDLAAEPIESESSYFLNHLHNAQLNFKDLWPLTVNANFKVFQEGKDRLFYFFLSDF